MAERDFTGGLIDRAAELRGHAAPVKALLEAPEARLMAMSAGDPLVFGTDLAWLKATPEICALDPSGPTLLGRAEEGAGRFAIDVSGVEEALALLGAQAPEGVEAGFKGLREAAPQFTPEDLAVAGAARSLLLWRAGSLYCPRCAARTSVAPGGWRRDCEACGNQIFPRTDPVVIMLVERRGRCLLARRTGGMIWASVLAGFVEPGETIEEAVRREVAEEAGLKVGRVEYVASQPWPFGGQLMIGCLAEAPGDEEVVLEAAELRDGVWATPEDVAKAIAQRGYLQVPPAFSIAHKLLKLWAEERVGFARSAHAPAHAPDEKPRD